MKKFTTYMIILAWMTSAAYAQQATVELNSPHTGNQTIEATQWIKMLPGFSYTASSGNNFIARIVPQGSGEGGDPNDPDTGSSEPEPVNTTPYAFDVSGSGAATFSIPINVPKGVGGMQPSISITYNSQAGNGVAGYGVNISGISVITRVPKDIYHDVLAKALTYTGDDAYYLDGQRLIYSSGTAGTEGAIYYLESDPFTKVTVHGTYSRSNCNTWFEVTAKSGIKYYYGSNTSSRQQLSGNKVSSWYMDYAEDPLGNYMNYSYGSYSYCVYLNSIIYGKNKNEANSLENKIILSYQSRPDPIPFIIDGNKGAMYNRLFSITTWTGSSKYREYVLEYTQPDHFSRLVSVTEKNGSGESMKPTRFTWNSLPSFYQYGYSTTVGSASVYPSVTFADQSFVSMDVNGDGISDLVGIFPHTQYNPGGGTSPTVKACAYISSVDNSGNLSFSSGGEILNIPGSYVVGDIVNINGGSVVGDLDGDGRKDLAIVCFDAGDSNAIARIYGITQNGLFNTLGHPLTGKVQTPLGLKTPPIPPIMVLADLNNDGKDEVITLEKVSEYQSNPAKYTCRICFVGVTWLSMPIALTSVPDKVFTSDFNGDGLVDIMFVDKSKYVIYWNQGNTTGTSNPFSESNKTTGSTIVDCWKIRMGDFNGDGMADFLMNATQSNQWYFTLNNGDGTFTKQLACTLDIYDQDFTDKDNDKFECHVIDFDFDGKSDVIIAKTMYDKKDDMWSSPWGVFRKTHAYWMRSTGTYLTMVSSATSGNEYDGFSKLYVTGDFDGDGREELLNYGYNCYNGTGTTSSRLWRIYKNSSISPSSGMVASIVPGTGNATTITYASLAGGGIYTKGSGSTYPVNDITLTIPAVKTIVSDNGVAGSMTTNYTYSGAKVHLQGKGFLGMTSTKSVNITMGVTTESGIRTWNTVYFVPSETYSRTTIDNKTSETTTKLTIFDKGSKKIFVYPNQKVEADLDGNTYTTTYDFDTSYGYIKEEKTEYGSSSMYQAKKYENYILAGGAYKPQLLTEIQKHVDDGNTFTQKTSIAYNTITGIPTSKIENYGTALPLTTEYTGYDKFGNCTSYRISGSGLTTITYNNEYDATKRFITKAYTSPASAVATFTYDTWGNVLTETDATNSANLLPTTHTYNGWGQRISTTSPDGIKTTYHTGWNSNNTTKCYFTLVQGKGQPWVKTWYDRVGRETIVETIGPKGMSISKTNTYNSKGQLTQTQNRQGSLTVTENLTYDGRGRLSSLSSSSGKSVTYSFGNRTQTTVDNGRTYTKTFDAWGNIKSSSDPTSSVTYTYYSVGKPKNMTSANAPFSMTYDAVGNQSSLTDPNAGTTTYTYDATGKLKTQTDGNGNVLTNNYDGLNRISYSTLGGVRTDYTYGTTGFEMYRLTQLKTGNNYIAYTYDKYGRPLTEKRNIDGAGLHEFSFVYNDNGQLQKTIYPGSLEVNNEFDTYGNLVKVLAGTQPIWELTSMTGTTMITQQGGTLTATTTLNGQGQLTNLKTVKGTTTIRNMDFVFNGATGNLTSRNGMIAQKETFYYDNLDRLATINQGAPETLAMSIGYTANGNISSKTGLGAYSYNASKVHALENVANTNGLIPDKDQTITYNAFNKVSQINETVGSDAYQLNIVYGPEQQRWKTDLKKNNSLIKTIIFAGDYEKLTNNGVTQQLYYISGMDGLAAVYVKQTGQSDKIYYTHTDHLGSIVSMTDGNGTAVFQAYYDAWGRQTITNNTFKFHRGYTGHEHLLEFGLINMNGRMYDPVVGRFLSPDPFVQAPEFSQSFNRYSYCINNPLKYTDPTGEFLWTILTGIFDFIGTAFFKGGLDPTSNTARQDAWRNYDPTASWSNTNKAWQLDLGLFRTDPNKNFWGQTWELISRHTWQAPQTIIGYNGSGIQNLFGGIRSVTNYGGATVVEMYGSDWGAVTFGTYIMGNRGIQADPTNSLFQHEYGHYIQSQTFGIFYLGSYGLPSANSHGDHNTHPVEQDANIRAFKYFRKHERALFDVYDEDGRYIGAWDFNRTSNPNTIIGYDPNRPYDDPENQAALRRGRKKLKIEDYFGYISF